MSRDEQPRKALGYIRVSTDDQKDSGLGLEAQRRTIDTDYLSRWKGEGFDWGGIFEDAAVSGGKQFLSRPAGYRMSNLAQKGDVILITRLDRAFRSAVDCLSTIQKWQKLGVRVVFITQNFDTETPMGRFAVTILAGAAEWERDMASLRTREGLAVARSQGRFIGTPHMTIKFAKDEHGNLIRDKRGNVIRVVQPDVFALGQKIVEWRNRGVSWEAIRRTLRDGGVRRRKTNIVGRFKENDWWSASGLARLHKATLLAQLWLSTGKAKWPKGWKAPDTPVVEDTSDASKP